MNMNLLKQMENRFKNMVIILVSMLLRVLQIHYIIMIINYS